MTFFLFKVFTYRFRKAITWSESNFCLIKVFTFIVWKHCFEACFLFYPPLNRIITFIFCNFVILKYEQLYKSWNLPWKLIFIMDVCISVNGNILWNSLVDFCKGKLMLLWADIVYFYISFSFKCSCIISWCSKMLINCCTDIVFLKKGKTLIKYKIHWFRFSLCSFSEILLKLLLKHWKVSSLLLSIFN